LFKVPPNADVKRLADNQKVGDHYALLATAEVGNINIDGLPETERNILLLIVNKLFCAVGEKHVFELVKAELNCENNVFIASGKNVIESGWTATEKAFKAFMKNRLDEETDDNQRGFQPLSLTENQSFVNCDCNTSEHKTQPPKYYTEDTFLSAMKSASHKPETNKTHENGKSVIVSAELGTPATRAGIIEKIIKDGYAVRKEKNIICTPTGAELISLAPESLKSPKFTAEWEEKLAQMVQGEVNPEAFLANVYKLTHEIINVAKNSVDTSKIAPQKSEVTGKCPRCGKNVWEAPKSYSCADRDNCKFVLWKENKLLANAQKPLTKGMVTVLLKCGKVWLDGLVSAKTGKTYSAMLVLEDTGKFVNLKLDFSQNRGKQ
jgi:DNA topoisomerase-3